MTRGPELILIVCEGKTEALYFAILKRKFSLPSFIKILPDLELGEYSTYGQHDNLIEAAFSKADEYSEMFGVDSCDIETWAVCDRDNLKDSYTKLRNYATKKSVRLAFSDPQFENYLLQHFSCNNCRKSGRSVERELSDKIISENMSFGLYRKNDLSWLEYMIDRKHSIVKMAIKNAANFSNHTKQPFFTVHKLTERLLQLA